MQRDRYWTLIDKVGQNYQSVMALKNFGSLYLSLVESKACEKDQ